VNPVLLVIAGPNGAGKTTVTVRLRKEKWSDDVEYLNPDDIARDRFGDWNSPQASLEAARWTTARREELLAQNAGIAFETVFSAQDKLDFVVRAKTAGYFVRLFFVGTSDPRINASRVANRVIRGGHTVPIDKIVSRYGKSLANLGPAIEVADRVYIYDNSVENVDAALCARTVDGALRKIYGPLPAWVAAVVDPLPRHADFIDLRPDPPSDRLAR
jgi:predicted ABC-type ATPase